MLRPRHHRSTEKCTHGGDVLHCCLYMYPLHNHCPIVPLRGIHGSPLQSSMPRETCYKRGHECSPPRRPTCPRSRSPKFLNSQPVHCDTLFTGGLVGHSKCCEHSRQVVPLRCRPPRVPCSVVYAPRNLLQAWTRVQSTPQPCMPAFALTKVFKLPAGAPQCSANECD